MHQVISNYISKEILNGRNGAPVLPEEDLLGSGLVDSIGMMRLVTFVEKHFETKIPPEDLVVENFITIDAIVSYLQGQTANS